MLRMDGFDYLHATSPEQAVALWQANENSMYVAGGTDLLPNLKHRIFQPRHVIGIGGALPLVKRVASLTPASDSLQAVDLSLKVAAEMMASRKINRLPVVEAGR